MNESKLAEHPDHAEFAFYETELFPGLIYKMEHPDPPLTMMIFGSGKVNFTGARFGSVTACRRRRRRR
eukprot:SAG22_NODE_13808_length_394_cov_0.772881_1_plen_67_part_01